MSNDSIHFHLDSQDQEFHFVVPQHFMTNFINTLTSKFNVGSNSFVAQPAFLPNTTVTVFIRNPYQPNLVQPNQFDVLVFLTPVVTHATSLAGNSVARTYSPTLDDQVPRPFFHNKSFTL